MISDERYPMPLSDTVRHQADTLLKAFCERRVPSAARDQVRMSHEFRGESVTLFEDRVRWNNPDEWTHMPIAQFRFDKESGKWTLYCADRNSRWHFYDRAVPTSNIGVLINNVDEDPTGIFFG